MSGSLSKPTESIGHWMDIFNYPLLIAVDYIIASSAMIENQEDIVAFNK